jgi:hypothetical protein
MGKRFRTDHLDQGSLLARFIAMAVVDLPEAGTRLARSIPDATGLLNPVMIL